MRGGDAVLRGEKPLEQRRSKEYASWIIEAREKDTPTRIYGNVMNRPLTTGGPGRDAGGEAGKLITNLPGDACVEVACMVDRNGISPTRFGPLPPQMAGVCGWNVTMFDLAATACIERSKEAALHALLLDPLTAAVLPPRDIKQMFERMCEAERDWLGGWE